MDEEHELCYRSKRDIEYIFIKMWNLTSITAFSIKFVTGVLDGLVNFNSFFPRVTPAANSLLV
jgi:hypothetical protein